MQLVTANLLRYETEDINMEFQTVLENRRSVRSYDASKTVTKEQIKEIIEAGILAPSWKNSQTARYYCVIDDAAKENFSKECLPEFNANNSKGAGAYVVTTFVADRAGFDREGNPDNECGNGWGYYDLGLHNENVLLKAKELGLDTLVMGIRDGAKIREMLDISEKEIVVSVIAVGYATDAPAKPKRKQAEDILNFY